MPTEPGHNAFACKTWSDIVSIEDDHGMIEHDTAVLVDSTFTMRDAATVEPNIQQIDLDRIFAESVHV